MSEREREWGGVFVGRKGMESSCWELMCCLIKRQREREISSTLRLTEFDGLTVD